MNSQGEGCDGDNDRVIKVVHSRTYMERSRRATWKGPQMLRVSRIPHTHYSFSSVLRCRAAAKASACEVTLELGDIHYELRQNPILGQFRLFQRNFDVHMRKQGRIMSPLPEKA